MAVLNPYNYKRPKGQINLKINIPGVKEVKVEQVEVKSKKVEVASGYKENEILNAKPEELTLMLYDGIIRFIKQAKIFNEDKKIEKTNNAIIRAQNIITELRSTLDMDYEISKELDPLYEFMNRRLLEANIKKDNAMMDEVLDLAAELRDTWKEAMKIAKKV